MDISLYQQVCDTVITTTVITINLWSAVLDYLFIFFLDISRWSPILWVIIVTLLYYMLLIPKFVHGCDHYRLWSPHLWLPLSLINILIYYIFWILHCDHLRFVIFHYDNIVYYDNIILHAVITKLCAWLWLLLTAITTFVILSDIY